MLSHFSCVRLFAILWTVAHQAPLSKGFSRQEYWSGLLCPSPCLSHEGSLNGVKCRRPGLDPWVGKISWRREWQPTPVFLPGESLGQKSLEGCSPWGCKEADTTE